jgi:hypothetical protein
VQRKIYPAVAPKLMDASQLGYPMSQFSEILGRDERKIEFNL